MDPGDGERPPTYEDVMLMASTYDRHGKELKRVAKLVKATAPQGTPATGEIQQDVVIAIEVPNDPKAVRVRVVVREENTERLGTADVDLKP